MPAPPERSRARSTRRRAAAPPPPPPPPRSPEPSLPGGLGALLRLPATLLGQLSGLEALSRGVDRLAASAEAAAAGLLDLLSAEAGVRRALEVPGRLERLSVAADRAATLLEVLVTEIDPERVRVTLARLDRIGASAERAAALVDRVEIEDVERLSETIARVARLAASAEEVATSATRLSREEVGARLLRTLTTLDHLVDVAEEMSRNVGRIEGLLEGVRGLVGLPLQNLSIPGVLRRARRGLAAEDLGAD
jgi:hypothetical protein